MCTLTWFDTDSGYELFFNRDEMISRSRAEPPKVCFDEPIQTLFPTDADAGGTWIAVNQLGITVCLLNHYQFEQIKTYKDWISRGQIVRSFAAIPSLAAAEQQFSELDLDDYRAFRMFVLVPGGDNRLFVWDGHSAHIDAGISQPKSSSSMDAKYVKLSRRNLFQEMNLAGSSTSQDFVDYHSSHIPMRSKESVCMHREEAHTVSLSHVRVDENTVQFYYADGSPCLVPLAEPVCMQRINQSEQQTPPLAASQ